MLPAEGSDNALALAVRNDYERKSGTGKNLKTSSVLSMGSNVDFLHGQLLVGLLISLACIGVHAIIMALVSWTAHRTSRAVQAAWASIRLVLVMMAAVAILMMAHLIEIAIWGLSYAALDAVPDQTQAFYFAFVNYTTLGYGDILPVKRWRLLGPMSAMNGVLLFGWSTAVIYDVLRTVAQVIPMKSNSG